MSAGILPDRYSNPLAQNWRLPNFEAPNVRIRFQYGLPFTVAGGATIFNQPIPIRSNSDFLCRELGFDIGAAAAGTITVRFRDNQGRRMSQDMLAVEELDGPIPLPWLMPRQQAVYIDIANSGVGSISVQPILKGVEQFQRLGINTCMPGFEPESYIPLYQRYSVPDPGWHDEPYDMYFEIAATALQSRGGLPLAMDGDADFYIRGITGYSNAADGAGLLKLRFLDSWQNQLSSDFVLQANEVGVAPNARPIYPEICCPAYSVMSVDATEYTNNATKLRFAFRGVKRYPD